MRAIKLFGWAAALALFVIFSCAPKDKEDAEKEDSRDSADRIIPVRSAVIDTQKVIRTLDYTANLMASTEINFAPASPGRINKIYVDVGSRVKKGQVLVEMDETQLTQAMVQYQTAKTMYERIDTLYQLGSISEQQYDNAKSQYELALTGYNFLKDNTKLVSSINGLVTGKYFEEGELYSGVPNTMAGKAAVLTLMQINPIKAMVSISQSNFAGVAEGMPVEITTDMLPGRIFKASIYKVYPTIDAATRTFRTEILIDNPGEELRPGMYVNIKINLMEDDALVVPSIAILKQEGTNNRYVFINENGVARKIEVTMGKRYDDMIEIVGNGLKAGAELIIEGQSNLLDGSKIEVVEE